MLYERKKLEPQKNMHVNISPLSEENERPQVRTAADLG